MRIDVCPLITESSFTPLNTRNTKIIVPSFARDMLFYLATALVPFLVAAFRIPIFSRTFSPHEFGLYAIATSTGQLVAAALFAWVTNVQWRFYMEYREKRSLGLFYKKLFALLAACGGIAIAVVVIMVLFVTNKYLQWLLLFSVLQVLVSQFLSVCLVAIRIEGLSFTYLVVSSLRVLFTFGLMLAMVFLFYMRIETFFASVILIDGIALLVCFAIMYRYISRGKLNENRTELHETRDFLHFGSWAVVINLGLLLLNVADRYIISLYCPSSQTGIYHQIYTIGQVTVVSLTGAYMSVVNPYIHKRLTSNPAELSDGFISRIRLYVWLIAPMVAIAGFFSHDLCHILLGSRFLDGASILFPVMLGSFLLGLAGFFETRLSYQSRISFVALAYCVASATNIFTNFMLIPMFGYKAAAYTTVISCAILLAMTSVPTLKHEWRRIFKLDL